MWLLLSQVYRQLIYATSLGSMAVVSSVHETSLKFAALIGAHLPRAPLGIARIRATALVALGMLLMRWLGS